MTRLCMFSVSEMAPPPNPMSCVFAVPCVLWSVWMGGWVVGGWVGAWMGGCVDGWVGGWMGA